MARLERFPGELGVPAIAKLAICLALLFISFFAFTQVRCTQHC